MAGKKKKRSVYKLIIIIVVVFAVLGIVGRFAGWFGSETPGVSVETELIQHRTITQVVTATGTIRPEVEVKLSPDVSGEIIELTVKEGDFVEEGQLLVRIRPDLIQARIDELNASLLTTKARMEQARASKLNAEVSYNRQKKLFQRELISEMDYLNSLRNYEAEQANFRASNYMVQSSQAQLRRAEEELRQTVIRAPMSGTISQLHVERGERVVGSIQMTGTELLRIARMEQMEVEVQVNENDIVNVTIGDTARIQVDAYPGSAVLGVVTEIANSAVTRGQGSTEQITEYPVKIRIESPHNLAMSNSSEIRRIDRSETPSAQRIPFFKPGMTATVDIETETMYDVLSVPIQSVTVRDFSTIRTDTTEATTGSGRQREDFRRVIFIVEDGVARMQEVETGISDDTHIMLVGAIEEGQQVVTGSYRILSRVLQDNDRVTATNRSARQIAQN